MSRCLLSQPAKRPAQRQLAGLTALPALVMNGRHQRDQPEKHREKLAMPKPGARSYQPDTPEVEQGVRGKKCSQRLGPATAEQFKPDKAEIQQKCRPIRQRARIIDSPRAEVAPDSPDAVGQAVPGVQRRIKITDKQRQVGEQQNKDYPEKGQTEIAQRVAVAEKAGRDAQQQNENRKQAQGRHYASQGRQNTDWP